MNANEYGVEAIGVKSLATNKLKPNPHNPRKLFDREDLKVLRESIARVKILVPLTVYREKSTGDYVILDGQRRWMCAQEVGLAAMSSSAGESGDSMLHQFRIANNLDGDRFKKLFMSRSDFVSEKLTAEDTVVLLDDFSGTGTQVCNAWTDPAVAFGELLAGAGKVYLIVVAASKAARQKITRETSISLMPAHELHEGDN